MSRVVDSIRLDPGGELISFQEMIERAERYNITEAIKRNEEEASNLKSVTKAARISGEKIRKSRRFLFRCTTDDLAIIEKLSKRLKTTKSEAIRIAINVANVALDNFELSIKATSNGGNNE